MPRTEIEKINLQIRSLWYLLVVLGLVVLSAWGSLAYFCWRYCQ